MATNFYGDGTNASAGSNVNLHFYDRVGIKAANRSSIYSQFASRKYMPQKLGNVYKISKYLHMYDRSVTDADFASKGYLTARTAAEVSASLSSALLAEGAGAVNKRKLQKVTMETQLAHYGEMVDYTDEVILFSNDDMQVKYHEELGELANSRIEDLIQLDMLSTGTVLYAGTATSLSTVGKDIAADGSEDANWIANYDLMRKAVRKLVRNRANKNTEIVTGSTKVDTSTVPKSYYAIIGADVKADLETATRGSGSETEYVFTPASRYASARTLVDGEVGAMHEIIFIESEGAVVYRGEGADVPADYAGTLQNDGSKFDVFPILFPTKDAFATVGLKGRGRIKFNKQSPEQVDSNNPYGTNGFFSYNMYYGGIILEEEKLLKVLVAARK